MALKHYKAVTPSRRYYSVEDFSELAKKKPEKRLTKGKSNRGGRNHFGRNTNINRGGGHKRKYRVIDFARNKVDVPGKVAAIEYDPNRTARIALVHYLDGDKRYILAPVGLKVGDSVITSETADIEPGNVLPLRNIPVGQPVHNVELKPGRGGQIVRSAGAAAQVIGKEESYVLLKLPSGEVRKILASCRATIGQVGNLDHKNLELGKAGRSRWLGRRPHTRGTAKNPVDHPMGGGEGKTKGGRHPCSPLGLLAKGLKTRSNKRTEKFIVRRRGGKK